MQTQWMDRTITKHSEIMDRYDPKKHVALVVDEWGVWLKPNEGTEQMFLIQQNSLRDGIAAAMNINIFARHADRVRMTNIAQMVNVLQSMIMTDGRKMVLTPTYHVYKMYVPFQDATLLPVTFNAGQYKFDTITLPQVDAIAARGKDGKVWLSLINLDPNTVTEVTAECARRYRQHGSGRSADGGELRHGQHFRCTECRPAPAVQRRRHRRQAGTAPAAPFGDRGSPRALIRSGPAIHTERTSNEERKPCPTCSLGVVCRGRSNPCPNSCRTGSGHGSGRPARCCDRSQHFRTVRRDAWRGHQWRRLGRQEFGNSQCPRHPLRRGGGLARAQGAQCALAGWLLCR